MSGRIYLLKNDSQLLPMDEAVYESEKLLQELLADHSDLLAGEQINSDEPRRWLLVSREVSIPGEEDGTGRWSLDHLFLDQDAVPTLVEVKRSTNTDIRRKVIGQMLDYAANAVVYWPVEQIQSKFEARCDREGVEPDEELAELLGDERQASDFWQQVKTNLQAGRVRMVFIADVIPPELRRIVEFLNGQMDPAEVLAIEIKQFVGEGVRTLVPRVLGQTEIARQKKRSGNAGQESIGEPEFLSEFDGARPPSERKIARELIAWATAKGLRIYFGRNKGSASFIPGVRQEDHLRSYPFSVRSNGTVVFQLRHLKRWPPFDDMQKREQLLKRLETIPGLRVTDKSLEGFPTVPVASLTDPRVMEAFLSTLDWLVGELRSVQPRK